MTFRCFNGFRIFFMNPLHHIHLHHKQQNKSSDEEARHLNEALHKSHSFRPCECNGKALSNHDEICWKATPPRSNHPTKEKKYQTSSAVEDRTMAVQIFIKATKPLFEDESEWVEGRRDNAIVYREMLSSYRRRNASAILRFGVITTSPLNKHRGVARCRACRGSLRCMSTMRVIYDAEKRVYPKSSIPAQHLFSWIMKSIFHLPPFLI